LVLYLVPANTEIVRLGKGLFDPFVTRFQPLLDAVNGSKAELERLANAGNHECMFTNRMSLFSVGLTNLRSATQYE
jgi:hypothetical protein